jgi:hypothetical protein
MGTTPYGNKITLLLFPLIFVKKKNISMGTWECMKLGELPWHNTLGVLCWGRDPSKYQVEIKREAFMF